MKSMKFEHYRELLLAERDQLIHEMDRIRESIPEEVRPTGEHEALTPDEGVEADIFLAAAEGTRLRDVDAALERIKTGTYGKCERCGRTIPAARLQALPSSVHCVDCANSLAAT